MSKPVIPKSKQKEIAKERVKILFQQAKEVFSKDKALANRYVTLARKIAMKVKIRIPIELKRKFCKHCYKFLMPGKNARIRTRDGKVIISCFECKKFTRIPVSKKKKKYLKLIPYAWEMIDNRMNKNKELYNLKLLLASSFPKFVNKSDEN